MSHVLLRGARRIARVAALAVLLPAGGAAQIAAGAPRLISPHGSGGVGVHLLTVPTEPGTDRAVLFTWAMRALPDGVRLRAATGSGLRGESAVALGIDVQAPIVRGEGALPFDLDWQGGIGASHGAYTMLSLPMGVAGSLSWQSGAVWAAPFVTAGLIADLHRGPEAPTREFEMRPAVEVGIDLAFDPARSVVIRAATSVAGRRAASLGVGLQLGPRAP